jgi:hypothetical protein
MDYIGHLLLDGIFLALLWLQWHFPLRRPHFGVLRRLVRNFVPSIPGFRRDAFSSFQLATADQSRTRADHDHGHAAHARHSPFHCAARDQFEFGGQSFVGGSNFIALCAATFLKMKLRLASPVIEMTTSSPPANC